ncbi:MAG: preprotein translocase subunit SecA [Candidatus Harrisonbacteria bacterium RIFCSPHIGHO2_02_FULL_42_16]|uniref:Protein translocase subunit SecA n=1 Tax=Candidatus Harrisonbacteria bacterium RIFCSPHIGHO2_02_FULL_42_16 TaxID=1798404 RepID=A0A1G1ZID4_9BACT|nr:MAG: preprotein translocase subunit SecA [Candidatus Harrisonbacteria bacterium RIFCSPHIGHO2_02_FULL_42_16]
MSMLNFLFDPAKKLKKRVAEINALEKEITVLNDSQLKEESKKLQEQARNGISLDDLLPKAFALAREAAKRTLGQRHFDVQLMGGIVLHQGKIAEMATGEGKTLASTAPIYLNALEGKGAHVVTVNEYLAKRDAVWMGQIYHALGLSVACLVHEGALLYDPAHIVFDAEKLVDKERDVTGSYLVQEEYLRPISRQDAYFADITYGTNHEFGFDYLRDNLAHSKDSQTQKNKRNFAVVDEIDSILIDEARTPLIISAPDAESSDAYRAFSRIAAALKKDEDYLVDEKFHSVDITESGIDKVEKALKIKNIYGPEHSRLTHYLQESLKAQALFKRDKDYVAQNNEIIIVDQNTGRLMLGRRYSGGLHQAIEAKEGVRVQQESRTYAQITIQNYFRLYKKLAGMTGTAQTSAEEFDKVYDLPVVSIPTNKPLARQDLPDLIYKNQDAKYRAVAEDIKKRQKAGQPVLVGTISIEKNELLSRYLNSVGVKHEILNAKNHAREGEIIAQAGKAGAVTLATNMAGRGVDIVLGGNPQDILESEKVKNLGGLHVIGTERHDARRIDNQLRGRSGRQGDPGLSQFFLSLEDDLMRIFGGDKIKNLMERLDVPEDMPIESGFVSKAVSQAQSRVEGFNFDARKHLLDYDDILNKQRVTIYEKRQKFLEENSAPQILSALDMLWMNHLENMEALRESVRLRAYGQHEPLVEYRREGHLLFQQLLADFDKWLSENKENLQKNLNDKVQMSNRAKNSNDQVIRNLPLGISNFQSGKIGRNDPCPCGAKDSGGHSIKYKRCHGS